MKMTPMVKIALYALRVYLIVLLGLIIFSFVRFARKTGQAEGLQTPATQSAVQGPAVASEPAVMGTDI
ncbi:MAG: hypothetical protein WCI73_12525 [Phycisphaerae bacterium]